MYIHTYVHTYLNITVIGTTILASIAGMNLNTYDTNTLILLYKQKSYGK